MQFGPVSLNDAEGKILAHNLASAEGARLINKGKILSAADIETLREHGHTQVYVAWLDHDDVDENTAAVRTAAAIAGDHTALSRAAVGRVNLRAEVAGVVRVESSRLDAFNQQDGIAVATLPAHTVVPLKKIVATVKIIPFGVPQSVLRAVSDLAASGGPLLWIDSLPSLPVGMILYGSPGVRARLSADFGPLADRVSALGSEVIATDFVELGGQQVEQSLADSLNRMRQARVALILIAGETAIMHRNDMIPRAVERAGGTIECVGAPVEPGNLLMLAYLGDVPVLGAPGCARSPKANVVDQVIPRLLTGERLSRADILALAHGGLLAR